MAFVVSAVVSAVGVGATVAGAAAIGGLAYMSDQQRKNLNHQQDAINAQREEDARKKAEAETGAQVAANALTADNKRRRRSSALELGNPAGAAETLGGGGPALAAGGPASASRPAGFAPGVSAGYSAGTALGAGSPGAVVSAGRVSTPRTPGRGAAL